MRATYIGCIGTHEHGSSSDAIVMLKGLHHVKLYLSIFGDFWKLIVK